DAVGRMRPIEPVHAHADQRIIDWAELFDRFVRLGDEAINAITVTAKVLERGFELLRRRLDARLGPLIGFRPVISRPENRHFAGHAMPPGLLWQCSTPGRQAECGTRRCLCGDYSRDYHADPRARSRGMKRNPQLRRPSAAIKIAAIGALLLLAAGCTDVRNG